MRAATLPRGRTGALLVLILAVLIVAGAALLLRSGKGASSPRASVVAGHAGAVEIKNYSFMPTKLTIKPGTKVTFKNGDSTEHTATADAGGFDSGTLAAGRSKAVAFAKPGVYAYHCAFHAFMTATITVN